ISIALITTVEGLIVAIPCTAVYTYARNRIDRLTGEVGVLIEEMMGEIEGMGAAGGGAAGAPASRGHAAPAPRPIPPPAASMPRRQPSGGGAVGGARGA